MMEPSSCGTEQISCAEAAVLLEKRITDELLSATEQQRYEHHISHCSECCDFSKWKDCLPRFSDTLTRDELDASIHTTLGNIRRQRIAGGNIKLKWTAVAVAAGIAALTLTGVSIRLFDFAPRAEAPAAAVPCTASAFSEPVPGVSMMYCDAHEPGVLIENGGEVRISLRSGTVGLVVDPNRPNPHKVSVDTPKGTVRVKGTVFAVHVYPDRAQVEVLRGVVEVLPPESVAEVYTVSAGYGADIGIGRRFALSAHKTRDLNRLQSEAEAAAENETEQLSATAETLNEDGEELPQQEAADGGALSDSPDPFETEETTGPGNRRGPKRIIASMDALIQDAQSCLIDRDWQCAAARYHEVLTRYAARKESASVLISLAKIELRHLNRPDNALTHYKTYQQRAPKGPLIEEAYLGMANAYRRLGNPAKEAETLRQFADRFPKSSLSGKARTRLKQLNGV